jgi:archaellum biogenesis protein FlaJ (TadC family)
VKEKWKAILTSSRFLVALATILVVLLSEFAGKTLSLEATVALLGTVVAWITGRTIRPDEKKIEKKEN